MNQKKIRMFLHHTDGSITVDRTDSIPLYKVYPYADERGFFTRRYYFYDQTIKLVKGKTKLLSVSYVEEVKGD